MLPNIAMLPAAAGEIVDRRGLMPDQTTSNGAVTFDLDARFKSHLPTFWE